MKYFLTFILLVTATFTKAQIRLEQKDLNNLIAISELYSYNTNAKGDKFAKAIDSLRTPKLNHIIDALIAVGKGDMTILENRFLERPDNEELVLWYVIREIHYNRINEKLTPRPVAVVANEVLSKKIDSLWLLGNYYYRIHGGIATLFNDADLSKHNFNIDGLGFKDETEKAIFFLNMMNTLVGGRFKVLQMMKNNKKILEFCDKLPKFNDKEYFYFKNFDYDDFDWIGYDKTESYNERHIGGFYSILIAQFSAIAELRGKKDAQEIYFNSILHEPKYFKFTPSKGDLQSLYDKSK
ncbi:hypothetical protein EZ428_13135 [Pedobacter frigiditerrae]|uniref:Uncharacterized protein n=1 Tax=Pedobacter frigiditerrae TaxID=2530452 RepID=A0A4R0MT45_9SPHI|nr:hypothetical protein [Pedobacter frigiditerrae]TCC90219.1 hypothetical protein EZ428_13135 [Pedobacter frigiditerrae]